MVKMAKLTHTEVQNAFLKEGVTAVARIIDDATASSYTIRRALRELKESRADRDTVGVLESFLAEQGFLTTALTRPDVGEERAYKIQDDNGRLILKVPVDYLGMRKGDEVVVRFDVDGGRFFRPSNEEG